MFVLERSLSRSGWVWLLCTCCTCCCCCCCCCGPAFVSWSDGRPELSRGGEIVLIVVRRVYVGGCTGIVGFPGEFPVDVHIWYEVFVTNPFEFLCLLRLRPSESVTVAVSIHVVLAFVTVVSLFTTGVTKVGNPAEAG